MKRIISTFAALAMSVAFSTAADEAPKPDAAKPDAAKPAAEAAKPAAGGDAFAKKDTNNDGSISKEEFVAGAKDATRAEALFAKKDKDGDGKLSKEEFAARGPGGEKKKK